MRTISIPEARKYCKERGWVFEWKTIWDDRIRIYPKGKVVKYEASAWNGIKLDDSNSILIVVSHKHRQYAIQAVYESVKLFEEITLHTPSDYIKRTKTRPTRRAKNVVHP